MTFYYKKRRKIEELFNKEEINLPKWGSAMEIAPVIVLGKKF